jgi:hypothetical protein
MGDIVSISEWVERCQQECSLKDPTAPSLTRRLGTDHLYATRKELDSIELRLFPDCIEDYTIIQRAAAEFENDRPDKRLRCLNDVAISRGLDFRNTQYLDFSAVESEGNIELYKSFLSTALSYFYEQAKIEATFRIFHGIVSELFRYEEKLPNSYDYKAIAKQEKSIFKRPFYRRREKRAERKSEEFLLEAVRRTIGITF